MKISELLDDIRKQDLVLPEFQREYVWKRDQAKQLMVSLLKGYPVGGLLFWKTDEPPELKKIDALPEKIGMVTVILDGQQRLTTLFLLIEGEVPPYYTEKDIQTDPRELYFNLDSGDFQYYQASRMRGNPVWWKVTDCFERTDINVFEIAKETAQAEQDPFEIAQIYNTNLNRLRNIQNIDLPVQTVPSSAPLVESIDIFDRVNSQGTKLSDADLALTHITAKWAQARRILKDKIIELEDCNFYFDLSFLTRSLVGVVAKRGLYETIHDRPKDELVKGWKSLSGILDYLVRVLPEHAHVHSNWDLNTSNVFVPLIVFLSLNSGKFSNEATIRRAVHWLYAAHTRARYTAQTNQRLEHDISLVVRETSPWDALLNAIIDQRGRIETKASDLEGRITQHPLYRMTFILAKAHGAVDWFNGAPIASPYPKSGWIQSHHIFPTSLLYNNGFDSENHLHKKIVNEIANRAFITASTNLALSNKCPEEYLPQVEDRFPGALVKQFIPMEPNLWKVDNYTDFLQARRELIALKLNEYMRSLIAEPEPVFERKIDDLLKLGESATLEFKSSLQWDVVEERKNKHLQKQVLKTVAAFLNSDGGTLVIGAEDDGNPIGVARDLSLVGGSKDKFANLLASIFTEYIGAEYSPYIKIRFEETEGEIVVVVDVKKSSSPAYVRGERGAEFYTRFGPTTRLLDPEETVSYIDMSWA